jgi:hypothetical protein
MMDLARLSLARERTEQAPCLQPKQKRLHVRAPPSTSLIWNRAKAAKHVAASMSETNRTIIK